MHMTKRVTGLFCLVLAAMLGLAACRHNSSQPAGTPQESVFTIASEDYGYPSPYAFYPRGPGYLRMSLLFDTLVWKDDKGIIPWLATGYETSNDGRVWTFRLARGVQWHDGQPLTAADVRFTFRYIAEHPHPWFTRELAKVIEKIETAGDDRVIFTLTRPYAPFLTNIAAAIPIMPRHIWEKVSDPAKFTEPQAAVGSGPFRLVRYDKASANYVYEANRNYFRGAVKTGKLIFVQTGQPLMALKSGEIDAFSPSPDQVAAFRQIPGVKVMEGSGFWIYRLMFNLSREPFNDVRFRQAVAHALNLPDLVLRAAHNGATPGSAGYVSPELGEWYNPHVAVYPYQPQTAGELLAAMGYDRMEAGFRVNRAGQKLSFELLTFAQGQEAEIIKTYLAAVGMDVRIKALEKGTHDQLIDSGRFQMAINGHGGIGGDPVFLNQLIRPLTASGSNASLYANAEYIKLAALQPYLADAAARRETVCRMQEILAAELPTVPLYYRKIYFAYRPAKLDGWFFTPGGLATGIPTELNKVVFLALKQEYGR